MKTYLFLLEKLPLKDISHRLLITICHIFSDEQVCLLATGSHVFTAAVGARTSSGGCIT